MTAKNKDFAIGIICTNNPFYKWDFQNPDNPNKPKWDEIKDELNPFCKSPIEAGTHQILNNVEKEQIKGYCIACNTLHMQNIEELVDLLPKIGTQQIPNKNIVSK